jgi:hypothetical protein
MKPSWPERGQQGSSLHPAPQVESTPLPHHSHHHSQRSSSLLMVLLEGFILSSRFLECVRRATAAAMFHEDTDLRFLGPGPTLGPQCPLFSSGPGLGSPQRVLFSGESSQGSQGSAMEVKPCPIGLIGLSIYPRNEGVATLHQARGPGHQSVKTACLRVGGVREGPWRLQLVAPIWAWVSPALAGEGSCTEKEQKTY